MKMKNRKISGKVTPEELAGDVFIAATLTPAQQKEADRHLAEARKKSKENMTDEVRVGLIQFHIRFRIEGYLESKEYDPKMSFSYFLKKYVDSLNIKRKEFAEQVSIDETLLSQLINRHRLPPDYLAIRLEIHSNNIIPANYWYKLAEREKEHFIKTDKEIRRKEKRYVHTMLRANL
jgi:hypothetical protein